MRRHDLAVLYDCTDRLTPLWRLGTVVNRTRHDIPAGSWAEGYDLLSRLTGIRVLHVWGHGRAGRPLIGTESVTLPALLAVLPDLELVWWRSCSVHRGIRGRRLATRCAEAGITSVGHTQVISAPNPLRQRGICALRPGEYPWWDDNTPLRGVSTLRMRVPDFAFKAPGF